MWSSAVPGHACGPGWLGQYKFHHTQPCVQRREEWSQNGQNGHRMVTEPRCNVTLACWHTRTHSTTQNTTFEHVILRNTGLVSTKCGSLAQVLALSICRLKSTGRPGDVWRVQMIFKIYQNEMFFSTIHWKWSITIGIPTCTILLIWGKKNQISSEKTK